MGTLKFLSTISTMGDCIINAEKRGTACQIVSRGFFMSFGVSSHKENERP